MNLKLSGGRDRGREQEEEAQCVLGLTEKIFDQTPQRIGETILGERNSKVTFFLSTMKRGKAGERKKER